MLVINVFDGPGSEKLSVDAELTNEDLLQMSQVDDEAADYLDSVTGWPVGVRAVELIGELAERVVAERLS